LRARANDAARASHHSENGHAAIPCKVFVAEKQISEPLD
jgi:hypothetical protein